MGAYLPVTLPYPDRSDSRATEPSASFYRDVATTIIEPTLRGLARRNRPFTGLLYAGLMLTQDGPKVVEFNCRFGDPETQALLPALQMDPTLLQVMTGVAGGSLDGLLASSKVELAGACVTTVLAAANYPDKPRTGDPIDLPPINEDGVVVFHAGTAQGAQGRLVTAGGRVLAVSAVAPDIQTAQQRSLAFARRIHFPGCQLRTDIAWREIARRRKTEGENVGR
jgi:phosphoribosylamine--glycine ligase